MSCSFLKEIIATSRSTPYAAMVAKLGLPALVLQIKTESGKNAYRLYCVGSMSCYSGKY